MGALKRQAIAIVLIGLWLALLQQSIRRDNWVYSWDSAVYIESARSLLAGRGLQHRVEWEYGATVWEPLRLWPPGYPILIAALASTGLDARLAALAISLAASVVVIVMLIALWSPLTHWSLMFLGVGLVVLMPAFVTLSAHAMSDVPYYALVLTACWCLDRWTRLDSTAGSWRWLLAAGLFSGAAWTFRNVALAWLAAVVIFLLLSVRRPLRALLVWGVGALAFIGPVAVRNILVFGAAQPYSMPSSELSWQDNVRATLYQFAFDFRIPPWLVDEYVIIGALVLVSPIIYSYVRARTALEWRNAVSRHASVAMLSLFTVTTVILLIVYRSTYYGEPIHDRYLLPVYGPAALSVVAGLLALLTHYRVPQTTALIVVGALCAAGLGAQIASHLERWRQPIAASWTLLASPMAAETLAHLSGAVGQDQFVLSDRADLIRVHAQVQSRPPTANIESWREQFTAETFRRLIPTGRLWGILILNERAARSGEFGPFLQQLVTNELTPPELIRVPDPSGVMFVVKR